MVKKISHYIYSKKLMLLSNIHVSSHHIFYIQIMYDIMLLLFPPYNSW